MITFTVLILAIVGLIAGIIAGFLGIGGGGLTVPILVQILDLPNSHEIAVKAIATSSLAVFITSFSGSIQNWRMGNLDFNRVIYLAVPGLLAAKLSADLANIFPDYVLYGAFGLMLITNIYLIGLRKSLTTKKKTNSRKIDRAKWNLILARIGIGGAGGFLAGLFGVGGGIIMVPLQILLLGESTKLAIQTSLGVIVITSLSATVSHAFNHHVIFHIGIILGLGGLIGVQISTRLLPKLPDRIITIAFRTLSFLLSFQMLWKAWEAWRSI